MSLQQKTVASVLIALISMAAAAGVYRFRIRNSSVATLAAENPADSAKDAEVESLAASATVALPSSELPNVDLNGDHVADSILVEISNDWVKLRIEDGASKSLILDYEFAIDGSQEGFCNKRSYKDFKVTAETPELPLDEWGCGGNDHPDECEVWRKNSVRLLEAAKLGLKGLKLDDGSCDAFHLFWDFEAGELSWWRH